MSDLYDEDILLWSERQAALLRRVAAGERVNEADLDWPHVIEEVESVGRSDLHAVESLLFQALLHRVMIEAWPESRDVTAWQSEIRGFLAQARRRYAPSMRQRVDLAGLYADAVEALPEAMDGHPPRPVTATCPVTLKDLLRLPD